MPFYTRGDVTIHYEEQGSGFPLLCTPGGGLNSIMSGWPRQVINAFDEFKNDFRCITMDQRNAQGGQSTGPVQVEDPWGAFADDQLGLMDHLGIDEFLFIGFCIGGPFAMTLIKKAPNRVRGAVLCQPVGHADATPDAMYDSGHRRLGSGADRRPARHLHGYHPTVLAQPVPSAAGLLLQRGPGLRAQLPDPAAGDARRHPVPLAAGRHGHGRAGSPGPDDGVALEGRPRPQSTDDRADACVPQGPCAGGRWRLNPAHVRKSEPFTRPGYAAGAVFCLNRRAPSRSLGWRRIVGWCRGTGGRTAV